MKDAFNKAAYNTTAYDLARKKKNAALMQMLLDAEKGPPPGKAAPAKTNIELMKMLPEQGAKPEEKKNLLLETIRSPSNIDMLKLLLEQSAKPSADALQAAAGMPTPKVSAAAPVNPAPAEPKLVKSPAPKRRRLILE